MLQRHAHRHPHGGGQLHLQGDAISHILRSLVHGTVPARAINIGAPQTTNIREAANRFGEIFGRKPVFAHSEEIARA